MYNTHTHTGLEWGVDDGSVSRESVGGDLAFVTAFVWGVLFLSISPGNDH